MDNEIVDNTGKKWGSIGEKAKVNTMNKLTNLPGEQIFAYYRDGTVKLRADKNAKESPEIQKAFSARYYQRNVQMTGVGYMFHFLLTNY